MGRYPFLTLALEYLNEVKADLSNGKDGTVQEMERKLRMLSRMFVDLKARGVVSTTNPRKITPEDIKAFVRHERDRGMRAGYICKNLSMLKGLLNYVENGAINKLLQMPGRSGLPAPPRHGAKRSYSLETVRRYLSLAQKEALRTRDWYDIAAYGFTCLYFGFGLRPKEARGARFRDLELGTLRLWVRTPKGKGRWTEGDYAILLPPLVPFLEDFLAIRNGRLRALKRNPEASEEYLVPKLEKFGYLNPPETGYDLRGVASLFRRLKRLTGLDIRPKDGRPSYGQIFKDHGVPMEQCSLLLRHKDIKTTQQYYVTLRPDNAFAELNKYFQDGGLVQNPAD